MSSSTGRPGRASTTAGGHEGEPRHLDQGGGAHPQPSPEPAKGPRRRPTWRPEGRRTGPPAGSGPGSEEHTRGEFGKCQGSPGGQGRGGAADEGRGGEVPLGRGVAVPDGEREIARQPAGEPHRHDREQVRRLLHERVGGEAVGSGADREQAREPEAAQRHRRLSHHGDPQVAEEGGDPAGNSSPPPCASRPMNTCWRVRRSREPQPSGGARGDARRAGGARRHRGGAPNKLARIEGAEVVGVCDLSEVLVEAVTERFGVGSGFTDHRRCWPR